MNDNKDVVDKDGLQTSLKTPEMRRILTSSFVGSAIEFYDFILYATASSIVFANLFFAGLGAGLSLFASFSTLAAGYLARPLGGVIFGHFGDKVGRKKALIVSMVMMGAVTVIIGLMPPTASIGMIAPASLFTLRIIQGIAVGGEWGGAALMALEHAPKARRGLAAAFANAGGPAGAILATLILSLTATLTGDNFVTWGWRLPFLLSAVLIVVGLVIRLKVSETPAFQQLEEESEERKVPLLTVFKNYKRQVLIALFATMTIYVTQGLTTVWGVSVAVAAGEDKSDVLNWKAVGALTTLIVTFIVARLSDRIGRKRSLIGAHVVAAALAVPIVLLIVSGELNQYAVAIILGNGIVQGLCYGPIAAYVSELFPPAVRYTGASVGYQLAAALGAGLSPMIASALILIPGVGPYLIGGVWALFAVVGAIAVMASRPFSESDPNPGASVVEPDIETLAQVHGK
ncbi:MFS transporter [Brevibacterium oceani]|uniref:MFS transporter n=1 Tax=Brevibacterium oceani TaxID=358099 RepID=UPI001B326856|nr:MFS transporter [Brevibacterium oceani]